MRASNQLGFRPVLETLEDRNLLAAQVAVIGQTLMITGDRADNVVIVNDDGAGAAGSLTGTVDGVAFDALTAGTTINRVYMTMGRGHDMVQYNVTDDTSAASMRVDAYLQRGSDFFSFNAGAFGLFNNSNYFFSVRGNQGHDSIQATMQNENDFFNVGANSTLGLRFQGGNGDDTIGFLYSGEVDGLLNFYADGGDGEDTVGAIFNLFDDPLNIPGTIWAQIYGGDDENVLGLRVFDFDPDTTDNIYALLDGGHEENLAVATTNVMIQNFDDDSQIFFLPQPVV